MIMRTIHSITIILLCLFLLTGCWDKSELVDFGYVQAVAFDKTKAGKLKLTTLFFKPTGGSEGSEAGKQSGPRSFTIQSEAYTVFEAIRDISLHFGRKAKWDHMRVILINEKVLQQRDIGDIMDFFARDHEPRGTALVLATKGEAADYLKVKPIIESTLGEQLRALEIAATRYSAKSIHSSLLDLSIQLHSEVGIALLPYIQFSKKTEELSASGISIIKGGKQVSSLSPTKVQQLLMLTNQFKEGSIEIPCGKGNEKVKDGLEVLSAKTKVATFIQKDSLTVKFNTKITGTVSEMHCSSFVTREDESAFKERIRKAVEQEFLDLIDELQTKRLDAIGIGNKIFAKHPAVWKRWRENWDERFEHATFECHVEIQVLHTGVNVGKPYSEYKEK